jgi:hypothetical protein
MTVALNVHAAFAGELSVPGFAPFARFASLRQKGCDRGAYQLFGYAPITGFAAGASQLCGFQIRLFQKHKILQHAHSLKPLFS